MSDAISTRMAELISAHALGALEPDEAAEVDAFIERNDAGRRAFEDALDTASALALATADVDPPAALRERIVAAARAEGTPPVVSLPRRRSRFWPVATLAAAAACAATLAFAFDARRTADDRGAVLAVLGDPAATHRQLAGDAARGEVVAARGRAVLVVDLPAPPTGKVYQAWTIAGETARPGPTFVGGSRVVDLGDVGGAGVVALTVEPAGGSAQPTTPPFSSASL